MRSAQIIEAQARRARRIDDFATRQRGDRRWVGFVELADWAARSVTGAGREQEDTARELAYRRLAESILRGEFEQRARSKVLFLDERVSGDGSTARCRLGFEQFKIAFDGAAAPPAPNLPMYVLLRCWLPADVGRQWLARHGYPPADHLLPAPRGDTPRLGVSTGLARSGSAVVQTPADAQASWAKTLLANRISAPSNAEVHRLMAERGNSGRDADAIGRELRDRK